MTCCSHVSAAGQVSSRTGAISLGGRRNPTLEKKENEFSTQKNIPLRKKGKEINIEKNKKWLTVTVWTTGAIQRIIQTRGKVIQASRRTHYT